jgi:CheY-like chemotaxis protein
MPSGPEIVARIRRIVADSNNPELQDRFNQLLGEGNGPSVVNVLVVEDSAPQRKMLIRKLSEVATFLGQTWDIQWVADGESAVEFILNATALDLLLIDEYLAVKNADVAAEIHGHDVIELTKDILDDLACVVIAVTSDLPKNKETMLAVGADDVWSKQLASTAKIAGSIKSQMDSKGSSRSNDTRSQRSGGRASSKGSKEKAEATSAARLSGGEDC